MEAFREKYQAKLAAKAAPMGNGHCIKWTGATRNSKGRVYGIINCNMGPEEGWQTKYVHRLALVFSQGWSLEDIAEMDVSHLCHNSLCINAAHLSYEPHPVNMLRRSCVNVGNCHGHGNYPPCMLHLKIA